MPVPLPFPLNRRRAVEPHNARTGREDRVDQFVHIERDDVGLTSWDAAEVDAVIRELKSGSLLSGLAYWQDPT